MSAKYSGDAEGEGAGLPLSSKNACCSPGQIKLSIHQSSSKVCNASKYLHSWRLHNAGTDHGRRRVADSPDAKSPPPLRRRSARVRNTHMLPPRCRCSAGGLIRGRSFFSRQRLPGPLAPGEVFGLYPSLPPRLRTGCLRRSPECPQSESRKLQQRLPDFRTRLQTLLAFVFFDEVEDDEG